MSLRDDYKRTVIELQHNMSAADVEHIDAATMIFEFMAMDDQDTFLDALPEGVRTAAAIRWAG